MLRWDDATLLTTLFHELAHQKLYIRHDTRFNESFAEFVGEEGLREYQAQRAMPLAADVEGRRARSEQFSKLVLATRDELAALYRAPLSADVQRTSKAGGFDELPRLYAHLRGPPWGGTG